MAVAMTHGYAHTPMDARILRSCRLKAGETLEEVDVLVDSPRQPFHFTLSSGRHLILKLSSPSRWLQPEPDVFANETAILETMADAGIDTPRVFSNACSGLAGEKDYLLLDHGKNVPFCTMTTVSAEQSASAGKSLSHWLERVSAVHSTAFGSINGVARSSWRECFLTMFEDLLVEAENMMIHLPYHQIRSHIEGLGFALDVVIVPSLVILGSSSRMSNAMVEPSNMTVTGLVDYSNVVWGDPAMMQESMCDDSPRTLDAPPVVGDERARHLLYSMYSGCSEIVSCCTGVPGSGMDNELIARRRLMQALAVLATVTRAEATSSAGLAVCSSASSAKL